jgi:chromosome segregation protein
MYLREITINGFKSFGIRTKLDLERGVTAIVGPNGCGKSNIAEAIRWVLGEQSAKALRGGRMQDVIFEGNDKRKPLSMCEVSLIFTDCENQLGTEFNEVEIVRRVSRDGSGKYFINGKACRLRDIQHLFMDTGVGQVSYSFLMQGQIDQIISSSSGGRRTIFEEAAGISKFKSQRQETINKLTLVDRDFARITDILEEVRKQAGSLKRQAGKALRYKKFRHCLVHLELAYNAWQGQNLKGDLDSLMDREKDAEKELQKFRSQFGSIEQALQKRKQDLAHTNTQLEQAQQELFELQKKREGAERQTEFTRVRVTDLKKRISEIEDEIEGICEQQTSLVNHKREALLTKENKVKEVELADKNYRENHGKLEELQRKLGSYENELKQNRDELEKKEVQLAQLRSRSTSLELNLQTFQIKQNSLLENLTTSEREMERIRSEVEELAQKSTECREKIENETEALEGRNEELLDKRAQYRELQQKVQTSDKRLAQLKAQCHTLEELQDRMEGFSEGAKAILSGDLDEEIPLKKVSLLLKGIQIKKAYTIAVEAMLGLAVDALLVDPVEKIYPLLQKLQEAKLGKVSMKLPVFGAMHNYTSAKELPEFLQPISFVIKANRKGDQALLNEVFEGTFVCDDLSQFLDFWEEHPGFSFYKVVSLAGEWIEANGLIYGGAESGNSESFIGRESRILEYQDQIEKEQAGMDEAVRSFETLGKEVEELQQVIETRKHLLGSLSQDMVKFRTQQNSSEALLARIKKEVGEAYEKKDTLELNRIESSNELEISRKELTKQAEEMDGLKLRIQESDKSLASLREQRDDLRDLVSNSQVALSQSKQALEAANRYLIDSDRKAEELSSLIKKREMEKNTAVRQIETLQNDERSSLLTAEKCAVELSRAAENFEQRKESVKLQALNIRREEEQLADSRNRDRELDASVNRLRVKIAEVRSRYQALAERVYDEYQEELIGLDWQKELALFRTGPVYDKSLETLLTEGEETEMDGGLDSNLDGKQVEEDTAETELELVNVDWSEISQEVEKLRKKVHSFTSVNEGAIDEYKEVQKRFDFLKTQSDDLWKSKQILMEALDDINNKSLSLFEDTFAKIKENFKFTFEKLTGGGEADLLLEDPNDVLNTGIEIIARPPGTKLKTLTLLSGGQKTITAVALLFAIYMVKPSPFCVLDELDAPLDDANISRFTNMLQDFTHQSQFLIITHSKVTVAAANSIYGVTMEEKGVSKVLSMRLASENLI